MIERYTRPSMGKIWTDRRKYELWLKVEMTVCDVMSELEIIPAEAYEMIKKKAKIKLNNIRKEERKTKHEVVAFLNSLQDIVGEEAGRWIHLGLTSSDIIDTALALQLREASAIILEDIDTLMASIRKLAFKYKYTPVIGRTHGIHAEPTTFGLKLAVWYSELERHKHRFERAVEEVCVGKISGAVGNFANVDPEVETGVLKKLGLLPEPAATQVVHRDRYASYINTLALIASSLEKFATELRHLQRTEVGEIEEPFSSTQQGSSAMPHKRNPITCERICGLARLVRSFSLPAMENIVLWHERDISHSSVERTILPDATILVDYLLHSMNEVISGLSVYPDKMKENIAITKGLIFSQRLLLKLIKSGMPRHKAHVLIQGKIMSAWRKGVDFKSQVIKDGEIRRYITLEEIEGLFDIDIYLRHVDHIFKRVFGSVTE